MTAAPRPAVTADALLGGRIILNQPAAGYRAAIDPVLLAAAVDARPGQHVLDLGAGTGAAALCLAARIDGCRVTGLEILPDTADLARRNARENGLAGRVVIVEGDLVSPPAALEAGMFDHVMANPPYRGAGHGHPPKDAGRRTADTEVAAVLGDWVACALAMVRRKGTLTFIQRAERLGDLLAALRGGAGEAVIFPLWPRAGEPAKRVIVRARKDIAAGTRIAAGLVLHAPDGSFTEAAEAVLRHGRALDLS